LPPPPPTDENGQTHERKTFSVSAGVKHGAQKVVLYGPGGVGKTSLLASLADVGTNPLVLDLESGSQFLDVPRVTPTPETWDDMRDALHSVSLWQGHDAVAIDSLTFAEELAVRWTLANVKHPDKPDKRITSIESYGYGKGFQFVYDTFLQLLADLDMHVRAGRHVVCIAHDCTEKVPNPGGEDWLQYQPRLQSPPKQGKIRERVKEWCDHLLYIGFDVAVEGGKGKGGGTRTIHPMELPTHWAKSRLLSDPIEYSKGSSDIWRQLLNGGD
jgi:hypothetical protein